MLYVSVYPPGGTCHLTPAALEMAQDLEDGNIRSYVTSEDTDKQTYKFLKSRAKFARLGRRASMVRFGGWLSRAKEALPLAG